MTFESFVYVPNPKKKTEDFMDWVYVACGVLLCVLTYIFLIRGFLAMAILGGASYMMIKLRVTTNNNKGANRFGSLTERLMLTPDMLVIGERQYAIEDLRHLEISADDFLGKSAGVLEKSAGIDNTIEFLYDGDKHSIQYQIKNVADVKLLDEIIKAIDVKYPAGMAVGV